MATTGRDLVSDIRGTHKLISTDSSITDRTILAEIRSNTLMMVKRETNVRKLWATDTLFTTVPCLDMISVPITECCDFNTGEYISRTKYKMPAIAEGNYQYLIQGVYSIDALGGNARKLKEVSLNRYINLLKLRHIKKEIYFMIVDGYLYVTDPDIEAVRISAMFIEDVPPEVMFGVPGECVCQSSTDVPLEEYYKNPLDKPFPMPGYLESQIMDMTSNSLLRTYYQISSDVTPNGLDGQERTKVNQ